jgi:uncharacterized protein (TIGR03437 family)
VSNPVEGEPLELANIAVRIIPIVTGNPPAGTTLQTATCLESGSNAEGNVFTTSSGIATCTPIFTLPNASLNPTYNPGTFKVEVGDENSFGPFPYSISPAPLSITGPVGVILTEGEASTVQITGSGGVQPYTFTLAPTSKLLPGGLALQSNGQIVGSSNTPGLFPFTVVLTDHSGATLTSPTFSIAVSGGAFTYTPQTLPDAVVGLPYAQSISVSGSVPPYTFSLIGSLPGAGLVGAADPSGLSYKISGTPTSAGNSAVSIKVTDALGNQTILPLTNFQVVAQISVGKVNPQVATVSTPFTFQVPISGGLPPYTVTTSPALPTGLAITNTGLIAGTPTAAPGIYSVTISVSDTLGLTGATTLSLELSGGAIGLASPAFPAEQAGVAFSLPLSVTGGVPPYSYALASSPSQALSISSTGILSGTISLAGSQVVAFSVTDSSGTTVPLAITIPVLPTFTASGIGNAASYNSGSVAPGEIVSIFGIGLGPVTGSGAITVNGTVSTLNAGTQVTFGTYAAPVLYASATQINVVVPFEVTPGENVPVTVTSNGQTSPAISVPVTQAVPGIFLIGGTQAAALNDVNQVLTVNGVSNPAPAGGVIVIYATGGGILSSPGIDGAIPNPPINIENTTLTVGGQPATVSFAGLADFAGVVQINAILPSGVTGSAVPIVLSISDASSSAETATIAIQ